MAYLKDQGFKVIALRDSQRYLPQILPADPLLKVRSSAPNDPSVRLPTEVEATRADLGYWLENMFRRHHYTGEEAAKVTGLSVAELKARAKELARTAIDKMSDATAPREEQEQRRRRLTKGPLEFREDRVDQPSKRK